MKKKFNAGQLVVATAVIGCGCSGNVHPGTLLQCAVQGYSTIKFRRYPDEGASYYSADITELRPLKGKEKFYARERFKHAGEYRYAFVD